MRPRNLADRRVSTVDDHWNRHATIALEAARSSAK
jgi:hypothetical protein